MAKIKSFDRVTCRELAMAIEEKLQPLAKKYGIQITQGRGSFSPENYTMKIEIATITRSGEVNTKESQDFKRLAQFYGLKASDLGNIFKYRGKGYEIIGMKPKSRKYPILGKEVVSGKVFKFPVDTVIAGLA